MEVRGLICFLIFILVGNTAHLNAVNIVLDFEDGNLPSASANNVGDSPWQPWISNDPGLVQSVVLDGSNRVLEMEGDNHFGWYLDLNGLVDPGTDYIFKADFWREGTGGGLNDLGITRVDPLGGADADNSNVGVTDGLWHTLSLESDHANNQVIWKIDGVQFGIETPGYQSVSIHLPSSVDNAITFGFGNNYKHRKMRWDNIEFQTVSNVPDSSSTIIYAFISLLPLFLFKRTDFRKSSINS